MLAFGCWAAAGNAASERIRGRIAIRTNVAGFAPLLAAWLALTASTVWCVSFLEGKGISFQMNLILTEISVLALSDDPTETAGTVGQVGKRQSRAVSKFHS